MFDGNRENIYPKFSVEWELQLLDGIRRNLTNKAMLVLDNLSHAKWFRTEYFQSSLELHSSICTTLEELEARLKERLYELKSCTKSLDIDISGGGTHPFDTNLAEFTPLHRYLEMEKESGHVGKMLSTFSFHIHVNVESLAESIDMMNKIVPYLPLFLAMSANSPYWHGQNTGFSSFRNRLLSMDRSYCTPPRFRNEKEYGLFLSFAKQSNMFHSYKDMHWFLRPRPDLKTLECRIMDSPFSIREAMKLTMYFLSIYQLVRKGELDTLECFENEIAILPWWVTKENIFRASKHGLDSEMIINRKGEVLKLREFVKLTFEPIKNLINDSFDEDYISLLEEGMGKSPADMQREVFHTSHSFENLMNYMSAQLMIDNIANS